MTSDSEHSRMCCSNAGKEADAWFTPGRFAIVLATLIFAAYPEVILGQQTFFFRDFASFGYPLAHYHRESFWRSEVPLWNPLNNCGLPFLAQWNTMVLYPGSLFYLLFPLSWSLGVFCLGHLFLAGLGMYCLADRWTGNHLAASLAGLAFAINGLALNCLMWPAVITALGWMPWVIWLVERAWQKGGRRMVSAALASGMQMLSGAPEIIILTWFILLAILCVELTQRKELRRSMLLRFLLVIILTTGLAAAQLLPFLDLLAHSHRNYGYGDSIWSLPAWGWANLFVPLFRCVPSFYGVFAQYEQYWTSSYYLGIGVLALAAGAVWKIRRRRVWILAVLAALGLMLALGDFGLLFGWLRKIAPPFGFMRYPIKFVFLMMFCVPLLAAFGLQWHRELSSKNEALSRQILIVLWGFCLALVVGIVWFDHRYPFAQAKWNDTWHCGLGRAVFLTVILGILFSFRRIKGNSSMLLARLGLLLLLGLDVLAHAPRQNPTISRAAFEPGLARLSPQPKPGESRAMISPEANFKLHYFSTTNPLTDTICNRLGLFMNCNLLDEIPKVDGFYPLYLSEMENVLRSLLYASVNLRPSLSPLCDFVGVAQLTMPGKYFDWERRSTFMPFVTAGQKPFFADDAASLRAIAKADFNPRTEVFLPLEARAFLNATNHVSTHANSASFASHSVVMAVESSQPALLVVAQAFYHPWRAYVDDKPTRLWRANYAFQAIEIPPGNRHVRFVYEDRLFEAGVLLCVLTLFVCFAIWFSATDKSDSQNP